MPTSATPIVQKIAEDVLVDLALQGGGAHGAFTWGVLDRLLEEKRLRIDGISGTSAGAMNAAALADGYTDGGAAGAWPAGPRSAIRSAAHSTIFVLATSSGQKSPRHSWRILFWRESGAAEKAVPFFQKR
jgi:Patatin-like phospholipase